MYISYELKSYFYDLIFFGFYGISDIFLYFFFFSLKITSVSGDVRMDMVE